MFDISYDFLLQSFLIRKCTKGVWKCMKNDFSSTQRPKLHRKGIQRNFRKEPLLLVRFSKALFLFMCDFSNSFHYSGPILLLSVLSSLLGWFFAFLTSWLILQFLSLFPLFSIINPIRLIQREDKAPSHPKFCIFWHQSAKNMLSDRWMRDELPVFVHWLWAHASVSVPSHLSVSWRERSAFLRWTS